MSIDIEFDAEQGFQLDAIRSVVELLDGQLLAPTQFEVSEGSQGVLSTLYGTGNAVALERGAIAENLRRIQIDNALPASMRLDAGATLDSLDFTVEMETGTGKTYVYLRTALQLHRTYGLTKFVIVVPSVAIREGTVANLRLLREHFKTLYDGTAYTSRVYSGERPTELRSFATSNQMEILVINISSFDKDSNVIYQVRDGWGPVAPIHQIQATQPVVILDEPQNLEGDAAQKGIASLNPLMVLRYSATHRSMPNPVYRLSPVDAYLQGLVKRIEVWPVLEDPDLNKPYIKLESIRATKKKVTAKVTIESASGTREKVTIAAGDDGALPSLFALSGERSQYDGFQVEDIRADTREVTFSNGVRIEEGQEIGPDRDAIQRVTIRTAVEQLLDRELDHHKRHARGDLSAPLKPLALFFIDRVANYHPEEGKFRQWFIQAYGELSTLDRYAPLSLPPVEEVHDGYFAEDRDGPKDSREGASSKADDAAYEKIMQRKDVLMSPEEPLRFIWSHSALREGWDNPNVFVIATLNDTKSLIKKRQEIGRGLRLPVMADGKRCTDPEVARLMVVANESYDDFAAALQREIEDETAVSFSREHIKNARKGRLIHLKDEAQLHPRFKELWAKISRKTSFQIDFDTDALIAKAAELLADQPPITAPKIRVEGAAITLDAAKGVTAQVIRTKNPIAATDGYPIPDLLGHLSNVLPLTRATIAGILVKSGRLGQATTNPQRFIDQARGSIQHALEEQMLNGIQYSPLGEGQSYAMSLLKEQVAHAYSKEPLRLDRSAFDEVPWESDVEKEFAEALDTLDGVEWFIKLPWWFRVETPLGPYNPDWAIVVVDHSGKRTCYLVRETKGSEDLAELRPKERLKIMYGRRHFDAIDVDYAWLADATDLRIGPNRGSSTPS